MKALTYNEAVEARDYLDKVLKDKGIAISGIGVTPDPESGGYAVKVNLPSNSKPGFDIQSLRSDIKVIVETVGRITYLGLA